MRRIEVVAALASVLALAGCASTTQRGYPGGSVKYSDIRYDYVAKPVLTDPQSKSYRLETDASFASISSVPALEKRGVRKSASGSDVQIFVKQAGPVKHEPGSFGLAGSYQPAHISTLPIEIRVKDKAGRILIERDLEHQEILGLSNAPKFKTREEAKAAMSSIGDLAKQSAEKKVTEGSAQTVQKTLASIANGLFEPRNVRVTLPAIRKAGDVDMEAAYTQLAAAKGDEQVKAALTAYQALGADHKKADGSPDVIGNYGVMCGIASAKVLTGDLSGAWIDCKAAWQTFPTGQEHRQIAQVLVQQQEQAGVEIVPKAELDEMVAADRNAAVDQLKTLFQKKDTGSK